LLNEGVEIDIGIAFYNRCDDQGHLIVKSYTNPKNDRVRMSKSLVVEGKPTVYDDQPKQAMGKRAEVATCFYLNIDPEEYVNWDADGPDDGIDIRYDGWLIDTKGTLHKTGKYLIWPWSKRKFYHKRKMNTFVFGRQGNTKTSVQLLGWIEKDIFTEKHHVANGTWPPNIVKGTWYMGAGELNKMRYLCPKQPALF